jgi:hypothetical protein
MAGQTINKIIGQNTNQITDQITNPITGQITNKIKVSEALDKVTEVQTEGIVGMEDTTSIAF